MEEGVKADEAEVGFGVRVHTVPFGPSSRGPWKLQILCFMNIFMGFFFFFFIAALGIKPGALCTAGKCSPTEP